MSPMGGKRHRGIGYNRASKKKVTFAEVAPTDVVIALAENSVPSVAPRFLLCLLVSGSLHVRELWASQMAQSFFVGLLFALSALACANGSGDAPFFLIFCVSQSAGRQSATAAVITAPSTGNCASTAASISRAVSIRSSVTPAGAGKFVGPLTKCTFAPASAKAAAIA